MTGDSPLPIWTVYDHPTDHPDVFVARCWLGNDPTDAIISSPDLHQLRRALAMLNLVPFGRFAEDDPKIIETWI